MKIRANDLNATHAGCLCFVEWSTSARGFVGHSQRDGLESGEVLTRYVLVGRLSRVTDSELSFSKYHLRRHTYDLSFSLGPRYEMNRENYVLKREVLNPSRLVFINPTERSNAVQQHMRMRDKKSGFWKLLPRFAPAIKSL